MKKIFTLAFGLGLALALLTGCGGNTPPPPPDSAEPGYRIADYYNEDGTFSALGLALDEVNSEKVLMTKSGDILIVDTRKYSVTAESLTLTFYTQSSLDDAISWWTDYCESRKERGEIAEID